MFIIICAWTRTRTWTWTQWTRTWTRTWRHWTWTRTRTWTFSFQPDSDLDSDLTVVDLDLDLDLAIGGLVTSLLTARMNRLATNAPKKTRVEENANVSLFEQTIRRVLVVLRSVIRWLTVTLSGHAWVDRVWLKLAAFIPAVHFKTAVRKLVTEIGLIVCQYTVVIRSTIGYYSNRWAFCLLLSTATIAQSKIFAPSHGIALVGSSLSLTCWSDSSKDICWEYYANYESIPRTIYAGRSVNRQYSRTHNVTIRGDRNVSLTLMEVQLEDAGMYQCRECSTVQSADIEVVVLGKQFQISWNKQSTRAAGSLMKCDKRTQDNVTEKRTQ